MNKEIKNYKDFYRFLVKKSSKVEDFYFIKTNNCRFYVGGFLSKLTVLEEWVCMKYVNLLVSKSLIFLDARNNIFLRRN